MKFGGTGKNLAYFDDLMVRALVKHQPEYQKKLIEDTKKLKAKYHK